MNDEAAPEGRPDRQLPHRPAELSGSAGQGAAARDALASVVALREVVADGVNYEDGSLAADVVAEIADALAALEEDLAAPAAVGGAYSCDECAASFPWPGLLQAHRDRSGHGFAEEEPRAA